MLALVPERCMHPALAKSAPDNYHSDTFRFRDNTHPDRLRIESSLTMVHSQFTGFKILSVTISNPPDYLAHAPIIDSLTFVMLSHTTTRPTLARSLHQQVLINSSTPSTSALSDSLPQPSTTPTAFGSSCILASFRQPSAAPDNPASLSTAFGSLRSLQQPSAVSASLRSLTFDITFTPQCKTHKAKRYGINDFVDMLKTSN